LEQTWNEIGLQHVREETLNDSLPNFPFVKERAVEQQMPRHRTFCRASS